MEISQRTIRTYNGIVYEIDNCQRMCNRFPEGSKEYVYALKIWVQLAQKMSNYNYEGEVFKI